MPATTFSALGTYVYVATRDARELARARTITRRVLADVDRACSRFRADSDLTRANLRPGRWTIVDPLLVRAVRVAKEAAGLTDGLVHPLLGRSLVTLGYDRDFGRLVEAGPLAHVELPPTVAWEELGVSDDAVRVPSGAALDLGATGKALAADLVAAWLADELLAAALVSVGGDLAVSRADGYAWPVAVSERPGGPSVTVEITSGGLATSSIRVRRWRRGGAEYHHLLDPRTGTSVTPVWSTVSCLGETAVGANTASTAAVVLGADAPAWLEERSVSARLVGLGGSTLRAGAWPADAEEAA